MEDDGNPIGPREESFFSWKLTRPKKVPDPEVMNSIQIAVERTVSALELEPQRDLLVRDFMTFESLAFDATDFASQFKFLNYAPIAFKYFRKLFRIESKNFLRSMCSESFRPLENSGSSGSVFFLTYDDEYILKTSRPREGDFLLKLLPGYYLNLTQNPRTLLPKFFGFYCYTGTGKNYRVAVMNNLIPSDITINQKYDLKGSTAKRKATVAELKKSFPTYKDLDFVQHHPNGLMLDPETHAAFAKALQRDCRVLESFNIIDYSLLLAIHRVKGDVLMANELDKGIPAWTATGEKLLLFVGIIDILQSYRFRKKIERAFKSVFYEKDSISVHRPDFYSRRFQNFIFRTVLQPKRTFQQGETKPGCSRSKAIIRTVLRPASFSSLSVTGKANDKPEVVSRIGIEDNFKPIAKGELGPANIYEMMEEERKKMTSESFASEKTKPEAIDRTNENDEELKAVDLSELKIN